MKVTNEELCLIDDMLFVPEEFNLSDSAVKILQGLLDKLDTCEIENVD